MALSGGNGNQPLQDYHRYARNAANPCSNRIKSRHRPSELQFRIELLISGGMAAQPGVRSANCRACAYYPALSYCSCTSSTMSEYRS